MRQHRRAVSVVVPVYNERDNLSILYDSLQSVLGELNRNYEIILVDDGSTDDSLLLMREIAKEDPCVVVIEFRSNFGQTAAMSAGIAQAKGDVIVTMDADLQNDPVDIPMMLEKIDEGYDLVYGWRKERKDPFLTRKLPSRLANWMISKVTRFPVHDLGCTLKAFRREIAQELSLYGEMHRFIPILAHWRGAKSIEVITKHHPRRFGESKYGLSRTFRVLLDLITVKYLIQYLISPMRLFGSIGLICWFVGLLSGTATLYMKACHQIDMTGNPLLLMTALCGIVGLQFLVLGMLGELGARIYYEMQDKTPYAVRNTIQFRSDLTEEPSREQESSVPVTISSSYMNRAA